MSNQIHVDTALFGSLKDKVVVLTGGASGIGAAIVRILHSHGAYVVFSDLNVALATELLSSLSPKSTTTTVDNTPLFLALDASSYPDTITLFRTALAKYNRIDHAISCAGVLEQGSWFDGTLTVEALEEEERDIREGRKAGGPSTKCVDVNLVGIAYFVRVAAVFLRHARELDNERRIDRSITLLSSAAGFRESPGLPIYQASKHGVMGIMRSLRKILYTRDGIRINAVCPGVTDTAMAAHVARNFRTANLGVNTALDVANFTIHILTSASRPPTSEKEVAGGKNGQVTAGEKRKGAEVGTGEGMEGEGGEGMVGKAIYVEQGLGWEFETGLWECMPQWLGKEPTERLWEGLRFVGAGDGWKK